MKCKHKYVFIEVKVERYADVEIGVWVTPVAYVFHCIHCLEIKSVPIEETNTKAGI
jgi:hypothetical protein